MNVDIWSDIRCPFCYIGKRKFENAIRDFSKKENISIVWHSFELDPHLETDPTLSEFDYLSKKKGMPVEQIKQMTEQIKQMAEEVGLTFHFENMVTANSFRAHRLIQMAQKKGLNNEMEEVLFKAHFTDGKNIDDVEILKEIGQSIGIPGKEIGQMLQSDSYIAEVNADKAKAQKLGISGVPFFVFNNKYAVSGAQPTEVFSQTLSKSWEEFEKSTSSFIVKEGASCAADGNCE